LNPYRNLGGNNKLKGKIPTMNSLKSCEYGNTNLCLLSSEKCKSSLNECTPEQISDTDNQLAIQNSKEKLEEKLEDNDTKTETKNENHDEIYDWLYRPYIFVAIVAAIVILILLLFYVVKKYIKYRYEKELKMTMGQRQYFVNHSLRQKRFNELSGNISNKANSDFNNDEDSGNRYQNNNTLSSGTRNSIITNYRPIYPENAESQQDGQGIAQGLGSPVFQIPALAYQSPQHRSTVNSQLVNNGDYLVIDQGGVYDSYNPKRNSLHSLHLNNGQLHNTRSRPRTRPRSHTSGQNQAPNLPQYNTNTNRYSYSGVLYTSSNASNRHSLGLYSNVNSVITNQSGNASNYGISEPGSAHGDENDYSNENEVTYDGKSLNQNRRNDSRRDLSVPDTRPKETNQYDQAKESISKREDEDTTNDNIGQVSNINEKDNDDNNSSSSSSFVAKLDTSDESEIEMPSNTISQKIDDSGIDGDNDSSGSDNITVKNNDKNGQNTESNPTNNNEINYPESTMNNNDHSNDASEVNAPEMVTTPITTTPTTPATAASSQTSQPLSKAELAKRESSYIKNHKRKIPVYLDKSRTLRVNSVVQRNQSTNHRRRHSYQYIQRHLSYSNKNSYSMNNLVQLNNPNVIPIQNTYYNPPNEPYPYDASTSSNVQPRNSVVYRSNDNAPTYTPESKLSKRAKHQSIVSIGSNGHATFYISDDNGTPVYSNSVHLSNNKNGHYLNSVVPNNNIQSMDGNPQGHQIHQHPHISIPDQGHLEVQSSPISPQDSNLVRNDSNTNISNLLRLANESASATPTLLPPQEVKVKDSRKQSTNSNVDSNSGIDIEHMNIYPTNVNVSGVPLTAFNINGVTYVPAGSAAAVSPQSMSNPSPTTVINRNSTIMSPNLVPVVNNGVPYINNINRSPQSPTNSIQSPPINPQSLIINTNYSYGHALSSPGVSPTNSPVIKPTGYYYGIPNIANHNSPISPRLVSQSHSDISNKGEIIHIDGQGQGQGQEQGQGQGQRQGQGQGQSSNANSDSGVPDIVLKSATHDTSELSSSIVPPSVVPVNANSNYPAQVHDSVNNGGHTDNNPVIYDEVIEVPGTDRRIFRRSIYLDNDDDVYNQMIAYDGILSESAAVNSAVDGNGQYVTYNYATNENNGNDGEVEFYYEEETEDEAPPPYSDTYQ